MLLITWSCSNTRFLPEGELLYVGAKVKVIDSLASKKERKALEKEFKGIAAMRGVGWVILAHDKKEGKLMNVWVGEHDEGHLAGATPLLVVDVWEHAFMLDYGIKRADYINVCMSLIDWHAVEERL